ncbi:MetQ/NlpA family ABC transporter substrate-binding protein [Clostridium massiliamazoniense]|uniref:MetQ/NlpA family ABC transporter substrate-binding protein n=1 Tax=Clostridium massiliamazoniense TaxID=1347366 RepID=UPI0006D7893F|nr:MetQ/NlpA family ABC transporter substrate-binding protein [Clostridium massiliamazoniense]
MRKNSILSIVLMGILGFSIIGCGSSKNESVQSSKENDKTITIGVSPVPHKGIVDAAIPELEGKGYKVVVKEFIDYVIPNTALDSGDLDANFFQHTPYLNNFNEKNGTKIKSLGAIHLEPLGAYSKKIKDIKELKDGATIAIPNDPSNEARALRLLEANGLIKLDAGDTVTPKDIKENKKNLKFKELEAALLPTVVDEVEVAVINGNYALELFNPSKDALLIENKDSEASKPYGNVLAVREGTENSEKIKDLKAALTSETIKKYISDTYKDGSVISVF